MRITGIEIARFGVWRQLALPVCERGLTVFYGPNEAGKTTLWRFIRGMLYGFEPFGPEHRDGSSRPGGWEGSLRVRAQDRPCEIRRVSERGTRGLASVVGTDGREPANLSMADLLFDADEQLFKNVFSVGLLELQELATLHADEVACHIYGLSLGPTGRRLLQATDALEQSRRSFLDPASRSGKLVDLLEREDCLRDDVAADRILRDEHEALRAKLSRASDRIQCLKQGQADLERQLVGHRLLERAWPHWRRARDYRRELDALPVIVDFPADGIDRLHRLDAKLEAAANTRSALATSTRTLREKRRELAERGKFQRHAAALAPYVEQAPWYREAAQSATTARNRAAEAKSALEKSLESLGSEWTVNRLAACNAGSDAPARLIAAADRFRATLRRRNRAVRLQRRLSRVVRKRALFLDERVKGLGGKSLPDAITQAKRRTDELRKLGTWRRREADLSARRELLAPKSSREATPSELPAWIGTFLALILAAGLILTLIGLYQGAVKFDVLAGAGLAFVGFTGLWVAWGLKHHIDRQSGVATLPQESLEEIDANLSATRAAIGRLGIAGDAADADFAWVREATARLIKLRHWRRMGESIPARRRRLSELRSRFRDFQRELADERQNWCALLKELGLTETLKVGEALESWQRVAEARKQFTLWKNADDEAERLERMVQSFIDRLRDAARKCGRPCDDAQPLDVLAQGQVEIRTAAVLREEWRQIRRAGSDLRRKASELRERISRLKYRISLLLLQGGAQDRKDFQVRAGWAARRQECMQELAAVNNELAEVAAAEPELALVEEDLEQFDADRNQERINSITAELAEVDRELPAAFEDLGSVKQSLKSLESVGRSSRARFELSQVGHALERAAAEWVGTELTRRALARVRSQFERSCQPATLALASQYLQRLTRGRYRNVWTPLGKRELCIDDDHGNTFSVDQLSGGTREQLFLAVRMATVRSLAQKGTELPMVFDDVLVNFDQLRTEAAVDTLVDFAADNQQVLFFTCHLHLAHLFESRGIEPTWLPGHNLPQQERRAG